MKTAFIVVYVGMGMAVLFAIGTLLMALSLS